MVAGRPSGQNVSHAKGPAIDAQPSVVTESLVRVLGENEWNSASQQCTGVAGQKTASDAATQDFPTGVVADMGVLSEG